MHHDTKVRRLPISLNFKDNYKNLFYLTCIALIFAAGNFLSRHAAGAVTGGLSGLMVHWFMTMIGSVRLYGTEAQDVVEGVIFRSGYVECANGKYRHRLPRIFRFDSQDIYIDKNGSSINVIGPVYILNHINRLIGRH